MASGNITHRIKLAAAWVFLAPLIILLGLADAMSAGRTRNWPLPR
jgi:hypothetical protein